MECSNDQIAYGRRRKRSLGNSAAALDRKDRVFEVSMTTLVKFDSGPALNKGNVIITWLILIIAHHHWFNYRFIGFVWISDRGEISGTADSISTVAIGSQRIWTWATSANHNIIFLILQQQQHHINPLVVDLVVVVESLPCWCLILTSHHRHGLACVVDRPCSTFYRVIVFSPFSFSTIPCSK